MFFSVAHSQRCVSEKRLRRRTPVRFKQVREDIRQLGESVGLELDLAESFLERGHFEGRDLILVDRVPLGIQVETEGATPGSRRSGASSLGSPSTAGPPSTTAPSRS